MFWVLMTVILTIKFKKYYSVAELNNNIFIIIINKYENGGWLLLIKKCLFLHVAVLLEQEHGNSCAQFPCSGPSLPCTSYCVPWTYPKKQREESKEDRLEWGMTKGGIFKGKG